MRLASPAADAGALELPLRLVLVDLLLRPMGPWPIRVAILALAMGGLLSPRVLVAPLAWGALALLVAARLVADWPHPDNHIYLLAYFCAGAAIALALPEGPKALARTSLLLLGLAFAFAVLWKAGLSSDYLDGRFFRVTLLTDERFEGPARRIEGLSADELQANRDALRPLPDGGELLADSLDPARHATLLLFCAVTYAFAPVAGFGWLLLAMGLVLCRPGQARLRAAYVVLYFLVLFHAEVPWAFVA